MTDESSDLHDRVNDLEDRVSAIEKLLDDPDDVEVTQKSLSLPEFKQDYSHSYHREKAVLIGYFLEKHEGMNNFTVSDLEDGYRTCKYKLPANMSDVVSDAVEQGHMMGDGEEGGTKLWMLTETGEDFVEEELADD